MKICHTCQQTYSDELEFCPRDGVHLVTQATETEVLLAAGLSRRFRLVRRLGQGGMGTVFLAEQIGVGNRRVALKVLNRQLLDEPDFLLRFQNEAGSTGLIRHENVVTVYDSGQADDGTPYIAMEFLEGESLREVLKRRGALPVSEVGEILEQAAQGLNAAHKLGIIHRDLKPDNIFLTYPDDVGATLVVAPGPRRIVVKIVDFGIAKLRESGMHTLTGMVLGTPAYMSYEQASGMTSDELDARSDIYSLGVVVYEMLTGQAPFHSVTPAGYLRKHLLEQPPPFRAVTPALGVPPAVEAAVMKALVKDRDQRYSSAMDFARAFQAATQPIPAAESKEEAPDSGDFAPQPEPRREPRPIRFEPPPPQFMVVEKERTFPIKAVGLGILMVVILVILAWRFWPGRENPASRVESTPAQQSAAPTQPAVPVPATIVNNPPGNPTAAPASTDHSSGVTPAAPQKGGGVVTPSPAPPPEPKAPQRIQVSSGVEAGHVISRPPPAYPPLAKMARIQGVVRLDGVVGKDGTIQELKVISGHPLLVTAAMDAVKNWRYQPTLINGEPVEVETEIDVTFTLAE
jgi:serine/threonine-protein kinase